MNRAVRRQQLKEPKDGKSTSRAARSAMPRTGTAPKSTARSSGFRRFVPRILLEVWSELTKVVWPKREDVMHLTFVIVVVTIIIGTILGLVDISFSWLIDKTIL